MKKFLSITLCLVLLLLLNKVFAAQSQSSSTQPLEKVKLQLKWFHQFQFAGYYAAKELGFYAAEGLDVEIFERDIKKDLVEQVVSGEVDFAVGDSGILSYYSRGKPIVALAAIFQHNPLVFIAKRSSGIISPYEMAGKKIMLDMMGNGDAPLLASLNEANLDEKKYTAIKHSFRNDDLIEGKVDVMSAYLSDQPFYFQKKNIPINIINPQSYGIDFYGDILFTSRQQIEQHPDRAKKFRTATLKGWKYALDHPEELVQLIHKKYHSRLSLEHLRFEAEVTRKLILPDLIPLGQIEQGRLQKVAEVYAQLKLAKPLSETGLAGFISPLSRNDDKPLIVGSEQDYPPFALGFTDETADGFTVELWRAVATEAHLKSKIRVLPFHDVLQEFKDNKIDVLINLAQSEERHQFADFTVPHVIVHGAVFVRKGEQTINTEADLKDKSIIVLNADLAHDYAVSQGWEKQLVLVDTTEKGFQLLAAGKHDVLLLGKLPGQQTLNKLKINTIEMLPIEVGFAQKFSFAVHKGNAELLAKINEGLALVKANGIYDRLYEKWFGVYEEKSLIPLLIKYLVPIVFVFLIIMLGIFYRRNVEQKYAARRLQKSEIRFRNTFEYAPIGVANISLEDNFLAVNQTFCDILGYPKEALLALTALAIVAEQDKNTYQELNKKLITGEIDSIRSELQFLRKDLSLIWGSLSMRLSYGENGLPDYLIATVEDITTRKQTESELKYTRQQAISANRAKTEFLANMSHEIRTPMNAILGFSSILKNLISDPTQTYYLNAIGRSGDILLQLINDVLDLSKIEAGKFQLFYSSVSLKSLLDDIHLAFMHKVADKNLDFSIQIAEDLPEYLLLDEIRLRQVLLNLVGNAVKFTNSGFIKVNVDGYPVEQNKVNLQIEIHDSGIGIAKDQQEKVFAAFTQQDNQDVIYGGTGLGLTICQRLLNLMHGSISLESEAGKGSCFTLTLEQVEIASQKPQADNKAVKPVNKQADFQAARILLVDDMEINRQLIKSYLAEFEMLEIIEAETGAQTLDLAQQQRFDLVLMDKKLPDQNGEWICQKLRELPNYAAIPIIMISASALLQPEEQSSPFYNFQLDKPVAKEDLVAAMQSLLPLNEKIQSKEHALTSADITNNGIVTENLVELLELLNVNYQERIAELDNSSGFQIDVLIETATELQHIAEQYHCQPLADWATTLKNQTALFDLDNLPKTLSGFTSLLEQLNQAK